MAERLRVVGVPAGLALAIALTGCAPTSATTAPTVSPTTAASAVPSKSPEPTPSAEPAQPALIDLVIGPEGLGPLRIGSPVAPEPKETAVVTYKADNCLLNGKLGDPYVGAWLANYPNQSTSYGGGTPFTMLTNRGAKTGSVRYVVAWSSQIRTATGVTVGSTEAEVKAAYPKPSFVLGGNSTRMYVIDKAPGRMIIEVATTKGYWRANEVGKVLWVIVQRADAKAQSLAGTDGVGACGV